MKILIFLLTAGGIGGIIDLKQFNSIKFIESYSFRKAGADQIRR